jgi:hypothetical protein
MNNQVRNTDLGEPLVVYVITCMTVHGQGVIDRTLCDKACQ